MAVLQHDARVHTIRGLFSKCGIAVVFGDAATLKGGVPLELRLERARTTKDVDLRVMGTTDQLLERLQHAGRLDLGDFLVFEERDVEPISAPRHLDHEVIDRRELRTSVTACTWTCTSSSSGITTCASTTPISGAG